MANETGRWTFTRGSRPEGAVTFDEHPNGGSVKLQSFHDTDPAHGQVNAFDLCRLHLYGELDKGHEDKPITERPSFKAMVALAREQPECQAASAASEFTPVVSDGGGEDPQSPAERAPALPTIPLSPSEPVETGLKTALKVIEQVGPQANLIVYGGVLTEVIEHDRIDLRRVEPGDLHATLVGHCLFTMRRQKGGEARVDLPPSLAKAIVSRAYRMRKLWVNRITNTPILTEGRLVAARGFAPEHQAWILAPAGVGLGDLTLEGAKAALTRLDAWLNEFPFDTAMDRSVALAAILSAAMRASLPHVPGFVVSKPDFGSGASTLCNLISVILFGKVAPVINASVDDEELRKHVDANMLAGDPLITIDNVPRGTAFNSVPVAQLLSETTRQARILGQSKAADAPCIQLVLINGNNITVAVDLGRRCVRIRLEPHCEDPYRRVFKRPLLVDEAKEARAQILSDAYTVVEAFRLSGVRVPFEHRLNGFDDWIRTVAHALVWLGHPDPTASQRSLEVQDQTRSLWLGILSAWLEAFGSNPVAIRELLEEEFPSETTSPARQKLQRLVAEMCERGGYRGGSLASSFGNRVRGMKGMVMGGMVIESAGEREHVALWRVTRTTESWLD